MRILRIFRLFRLLKQFYLLNMGFIDALSSIAWLGCLCWLILYICAIMLCRLIGRPDPNDPLAPLRVQCFGSISDAMTTLFLLMVFPDFSRFRPLYSDNVAMQAFLIAFIVFGAFAIVSILTGVISEAMFEKSRARQNGVQNALDRGRTQFIRGARKIFQDHDESGHGFLEQEQFNRCKGDVMALSTSQYMALQPKDLDAMFDLVDYDGVGKIEIDELLYGMVQLSADVRPMSIMELRHIVVRGLHEANQHISALDSRLLQMEEHVSELLHLPQFGGAPATEFNAHEEHSNQRFNPEAPAPPPVPLPAFSRSGQGSIQMCGKYS